MCSPIPPILLALAFLWAGTSLSSQSIKASLLLNTGGGTPGSDEFTIELASDSILRVTKKGLPITSKSKLTETSISKPLSAQDAERIFSLAKMATDFAQTTSGSFADGTNAGMCLRIGGKSIKRKCFNEPRWPVGPKTKVLLAEINKHLPQQMQVY